MDDKQLFRKDRPGTTEIQNADLGRQKEASLGWRIPLSYFLALSCPEPHTCSTKCVKLLCMQTAIPVGEFMDGENSTCVFRASVTTPHCMNQERPMMQMNWPHDHQTLLSSGPVSLTLNAAYGRTMRRNKDIFLYTMPFVPSSGRW